MRQAMELQNQMQQQRAELADKTFEGTAGGGVVTAIVRGDGTLDRVTIDDSVLDDADMLGDLIVAAVNQALASLSEEAAAGLGAVDGLDLGGILG